MDPSGRPPRARPLLTRAASAAACVFVVGLIATGCGLRPDDQPQAISPSSLPPALFGSPSTAVTGETAEIFLVTNPESGSPRLVPTQVGVPERATNDVARAETALKALLTKAPEKSEKLVSYVKDTPLLGLTPDGGTLEVNVGTLPVEGAAQAQAFAQIVYTIAAQRDFTKFRFLVNGKSVSIPVGDRNAEAGAVLSTADFAKFSPDPSGSTTSSTTSTTSTTSASVQAGTTTPTR